MVVQSSVRSICSSMVILTHTNWIDLIHFAGHMKDGSVTGTLCKEIELTIDDGSRVDKIPVTIWIAS